jgi:hypothetical protein
MPRRKAPFRRIDVDWLAIGAETTDRGVASRRTRRLAETRRVFNEKTTDYVT